MLFEYNLINYNMVVRLTIQNTLNDDIFPIEMENTNSTVEDIKVLICAEKGIDVDDQILLFNGALLGQDSKTLA